MYRVYTQKASPSLPHEHQKIARSRESRHEKRLKRPYHKRIKWDSGTRHSGGKNEFFRFLIVDFFCLRLLIYKTYLLTWLRGISNAKRMSDETSSVGTPARYLFSGIYAGDRHKHDGGAAAAPDKFNGLLRDATAGIAIRLCGTYSRETNLKRL